MLPAAGIGTAVNLQCVRCHSAAHDIPVTPVTPEDIPLYAGLKWSAPYDAKLYAGETWMPSDFLAGGRLQISQRSNTITGKAVRDYYNSELTSRGWILASVLPDDQSDYYDMTFTLGQRKVRIGFYGGENHTGAPVASTGYKVEILFK